MRTMWVRALAIDCHFRVPHGCDDRREAAILCVEYFPESV